jgi:hypothetical protein
MTTYDFGDNLRFSEGTRQDASAIDILLAEIPDAIRVRPARKADDRRGTDWWVTLRNGQTLSVDLKARRKDWAVDALNPRDDLALETYSVIEKEVPGWTRDPLKQTDYVLWHWADTGRWCLIPFRMLCRVFELRWRDWREQYKPNRQFTPGFGGYHSECVFVPRRVVWAALYQHFSGPPPSAPPPSSAPDLFNRRGRP